MTDRFRIYRPLLDLIGYTEGTDEGDGYNETLAFGAYTGGDVNLTGMSLDQVDALQTRMLAHPNNKWNSSAVGRYQIVRTTLRKIRKQLGLPGTAPFNTEMQDRMACYLLGGRGIDRFIKGQMTADAMINALAKEWASLPTTADRGHYGGQHARVDSATVRKVLQQVKANAVTAPKPMPKPAESVIDDADKPLTQSKTAIGTAVTTCSGVAGAAKEAADAAKQAKDAGEIFMSVGPWVLLVIVILAVGGFLLWERRRKAREARKAQLAVAGLA